MAEFIEGVPYIHTKAALFLKKKGWGSKDKYTGTRVCDIYEALLSESKAWKAEDMKSFKELKQAIFNALCLAVEEANSVDDKKLDNLMGITGINRNVAQALYRAGYKDMEDFVSKSDVYLRKRSCEIYDKLFNSVEVTAWSAPKIWSSVLTALTLQQTPPNAGPSILRPP